MVALCTPFKMGAKISSVCSILCLKHNLSYIQPQATKGLYDHSHRQDKQSHDGRTKLIALFARLDALPIGVALVEEPRYEVDDGCVVAM